MIFAVRTVDGAEVVGSESCSSASNRQTPAPSVSSVIKSEPSNDIDVEETTEAASPSPQPPPLQLPSPPSLPQITSPVTPNINQQTATKKASSSKEKAKNVTPARVTRKASRDVALKTTSTPSTPSPAAAVAAASAAKALNQSTPNQAKPKSAAKRQGRKSSAREPTNSFQCKHCEYTTAWKCNFSRHLLIHKDSDIDLEKFQCETCAHLHDTHSNLPSKRRLNADEIENLPFACNLCNLRFQANDLLDIHHMTVHRHQCSKCKKKFANQQQAEVHATRCK